MIARRSFLKRTGMVVAAAVGGQTMTRNNAFAQPSAVVREPDTFRLGMAGYTFNKFKLEPTLEMLKKVDVHYLCIKDFHLPLKSTADEIAAFHAKCRSFEVTGYGVGPIYMGSEAEANDAFAYAKRVGVNLVVGVPFKMIGQKRVSSPELLKYIERKVQESNIKYAIHNHGPDMPDLFPSAESCIEIIRDMDKRVGLCLDIGHQLRDGKDPVKALLDFADRVHDIHIKNVTSSGKGGRSIEMPRGAIDLPAFVRALRKVKYNGVCSLEYEKDMDNPLLGVAESIGYFRGLMDATR
ncbi:MAG TPA: sugar phosphate isomerase/epimerase [Candidatus Paceibacterota bacterium]|nr:sugar phosphate isomerase/epimerase [Verrucomicrobiota bacterium]HRY50386.1 sugar phosphate isomerase/epimerase [Candidatus Paceibacterota bacterium]